MTFIIRDPAVGLRFSENLVLGTGHDIKNTADGVPELQDRAFGVKAYLSAANVPLATGTWMALQFDRETFDDGLHSTSSNLSRFTVPTGRGGKYMVIAHAVFTTGAESIRQVRLRKNGTYVEGEARLIESGAGMSVTFSTVAALNAGDYLEMLVYQNSGTTIYVCGSSTQYTTMSMVRMGV